MMVFFFMFSGNQQYNTNYKKWIMFLLSHFLIPWCQYSSPDLYCNGVEQK